MLVEEVDVLLHLGDGDGIYRGLGGVHCLSWCVRDGEDDIEKRSVKELGLFQRLLDVSPGRTASSLSENAINGMNC